MRILEQTKYKLLTSEKKASNLHTHLLHANTRPNKIYNNSSANKRYQHYINMC